MYQNLRENFEKVTGAPLTISDTDIEAAILGEPKFCDAFVELQSTEEKQDYVQRNIADITVAIAKMQGGAGTAPGTEAPATDDGIPEPAAFERLSDSKKALVSRLMSQDRDLKRARSTKATIDGVLIARPAPASWMKDVPHCPADVEKAKKMMSSTYEGDVFDWLKSANDKAIIVPTAEQLTALAAKHKEDWLRANEGKGESDYKAPSWVINDQDTDVQAIKQLLDSNAPFQVMVATDKPDMASHVNPWKWATKGYIITYPESLEGDGAPVTKNFSVPGLRNFLFTEADGAIVAPQEKAKERMTARLALVRKRGAARSIQEPTTVVRVRNNNPKVVTEAMLHPITATTGQTKKMNVKSLMSYLTVQCVRDTSATGSSAVHFRVTRRRLNLTWETAPEFKLLPEYENLPGLSINRGASTQGKLSSKQRANVNVAMQNMYAQLVSASISSDELAKEGLDSIAADVMKEAATAAANDAERYS